MANITYEPSDEEAFRLQFNPQSLTYHNGDATPVPLGAFVKMCFSRLDRSVTLYIRREARSVRMYRGDSFVLILFTLYTVDF